MYTVFVGQEKRDQFDSRRDAVREAKEISSRTHRDVKVLNGGKFERLMFRRGELQEGVFVTRDRRNRLGPLS